MIPGVRGVCQSCFGDAPDCSGSTASCPWVKDVANNVIAVTAAAGGVITLEKILPNKFVRLFMCGVRLLRAGVRAAPLARVGFASRIY